MSAHRAAHGSTPADREFDRMVLTSWERVLIAFVPAILAGLSSAVVNEALATLFVVIVGGAAGALICMTTVRFFHYRGWPRRYAYATAAVVFVVVALVPIMMSADAVAPKLRRFVL